MKANRVLKQLNSSELKLEQFSKVEKKSRNQVNPQTKEVFTVEAKKATPIITINEKNKIFFNQEVIDLYKLNGLNFTIVNVDNINYFVATNNLDVTGLLLTKGKRFTADMFVKELRNMENGWSNNFLLEEVQVDVPFLTGNNRVFKIKLNTIHVPKPPKVRKERVKKVKEPKVSE